jgi:endonuclease YncB( thermonuclease family)
MDIDAPETSQALCESEQAAGYEAKARLLMLLRTGFVGISLRGIDKYGRTLGRLFVDSLPVADIMIRKLWARPYHGERRKPWCE